MHAGNPPSSAGALSGASVRAAGSGPLSMPPPSSVGALSFDVPSKYGDSSGPVLSAKAAALFAYKNSAPSGGSSSGNHSVIIAVSSTVGGLVAVVSLVAVGIIMRRSRSASPTPGAKVEGPFRKRFLGAARLPGSAPSRSRLGKSARRQIAVERLEICWLHRPRMRVHHPLILYVPVPSHD